MYSLMFFVGLLLILLVLYLFPFHQPLFQVPCTNLSNYSINTFFGDVVYPADYLCMDDAVRNSKDIRICNYYFDASEGYFKDFDDRETWREGCIVQVVANTNNSELCEELFLPTAIQNCEKLKSENDRTIK